MLPKFSITSFCKIDKTPFFETIFRKSKLDIYKCPFLKISIDFFSHFFKSGENLLLFLSLKTIKIRLEITFVEYLLYYTKKMIVAKPLMQPIINKSLDNQYLTHFPLSRLSLLWRFGTRYLDMRVGAPGCGGGLGRRGHRRVLFPFPLTVPSFIDCFLFH